MSVLEVEVDLFTLHVDAGGTIQAVLDAVGQDADSAALHQILATVADGVAVSVSAGRPGRERSVQGSKLVSTVDEAVAAMAAAGVVSACTVWREPATGAYLSQGRYLTLLQVRLPFQVRLRTRDLPAQERVVGLAAGWYLLGEVGDVVPVLVGVASVDQALVGDMAQIAEVAERLTALVVEVEGFGASRCEARCAACAGRWYAEAGSWSFAAEDGGLGWFYDDACGFADNTIACPACGSGRVGFAIC